MYNQSASLAKLGWLKGKSEDVAAMKPAAAKDQESRSGRKVLLLEYRERIREGAWDSVSDVVERVVQVTRNGQRTGRRDLAVDSTGVGGRWICRGGETGGGPMPVTITSGQTETIGGGSYGAPKRDLIIGLRVVLQWEGSGLRRGCRLDGSGEDVQGVGGGRTKGGMDRDEVTIIYPCFVLEFGRDDAIDTTRSCFEGRYRMASWRGNRTRARHGLRRDSGAAVRSAAWRPR